MCGIVGIVATGAVNQRLYDALTVLQHRGQDAAGIATSSGEGELCVRKGRGLVRDVFQQHHMLELKGNIGIGHVRYPTAGCDSASEAQPFYVNAPYGICLGHNGNLTNAAELAEILIREDRRHLNTSSDSEVLLNVFASELQRVGTARITPADVFAALSAVYRRCRGGYAVVAMIIGHGVLGFRDPHGIRPLVLGERRTSRGTEWMLASESVALDALSFRMVRDVAPGEAVFIDEHGRLHTQQCVASAAPPVRFPNVYGIDMPAASELVASGRTVEEVARLIGADWLVYQDLDDLIAACKHEDARIEEFDTSCFSGEYVTGDVTPEYLERLQLERSEAARLARRDDRGKLKVVR